MLDSFGRQKIVLATSICKKMNPHNHPKTQGGNEAYILIPIFISSALFWRRESGDLGAKASLLYEASARAQGSAHEA